MNYLLDTNVISELARAKPEQAVLQWFADIPNEALYISVLTIGEIRYGIEKITDVKRKEKLRIWLENDLSQLFEDRILPINQHITDKWGRLRFQMKRPLPAIDSLLAATAIVHDLCFVTRNDKDFKFPGLELINPWMCLELSC
jgi:toxin FitB